MDWIEDRVHDPREMRVEIAEALRWTMRHSTRMLYVHTENAAQSRWCAWEIGSFEAIKPGRILVDYRGKEELTGYIASFPRFDEV